MRKLRYYAVFVAFVPCVPTKQALSIAPYRVCVGAHITRNKVFLFLDGTVGTVGTKGLWSGVGGVPSTVPTPSLPLERTATNSQKKARFPAPLLAFIVKCLVIKTPNHRG